MISIVVVVVKHILVAGYEILCGRRWGGFEDGRWSFALGKRMRKSART
jgi:hypothetical protein